MASVYPAEKDFLLPIIRKTTDFAMLLEQKIKIFITFLFSYSFNKSVYVFI